MRNPSGFCVRIYFELLIVIQIPDCCGEHQLDSVQLIDLTGTRIVINSNDVGLRMGSSDFLDDTLSDDMIWQAAKWLDTYDIRHTSVDEFHHFTGKEPAFTGLVAWRYDGRCHFCQVSDICGRCEMTAFRKGFIGGFTDPFDSFDSEIAQDCF